MAKAFENISRRKLAFWDSLWQHRIMHMHGKRAAQVRHPLIVTHPRTHKNVITRWLFIHTDTDLYTCSYDVHA